MVAVMYVCARREDRLFIEALTCDETMQPMRGWSDGEDDAKGVKGGQLGALWVKGFATMVASPWC